ncbi:hypothetical protein L5515_018994 [Caenorhabditis briggsae]|uniref:Uncharacterized protein n=1 Tax=Caenorhabditis briggsae TaxID=6238 RepID=A0AAE9FD46_CAEBR|nr:hypothetical protein L5515_018994 [Caenorhabditis briggsae]
MNGNEDERNKENIDPNFLVFRNFLVFDEDNEDDENEEDEEDDKNDEGEYFVQDGGYDNADELVQEMYDLQIYGDSSSDESNSDDESNDEEIIEAEIRQEIEEQLDFFRNFMANRNGQNVEPQEELNRNEMPMNENARYGENGEGEVGVENDEDDEWWQAQFAQNNSLLNLEPSEHQEHNETAEIGNDGMNDWPLEILARTFRVELSVLEMALELEAVVEHFEANEFENEDF